MPSPSALEHHGADTGNPEAGKNQHEHVKDYGKGFRSIAIPVLAQPKKSREEIEHTEKSPAQADNDEDPCESCHGGLLLLRMVS